MSRFIDYFSLFYPFIFFFVFLIWSSPEHHDHVSTSIFAWTSIVLVHMGIWAKATSADMLIILTKIFDPFNLFKKY